MTSNSKSTWKAISELGLVPMLNSILLKKSEIELHNVKEIRNYVWNWRPFCQMQENEDRKVWRNGKSIVGVLQKYSPNMCISGSVVKGIAVELNISYQTNGMTFYKVVLVLCIEPWQWGSVCRLNEVDTWKSSVLPSEIAGYEPIDVLTLTNCAILQHGLWHNRMKSTIVWSTLLVGTNMDGSEKLPLLVVGNIKNHKVLSMW